MNNERPTTQPTEAPEQPTLPGIEESAAQAETRPSGSVSDAVDLAAENAQLKVELYMRAAIYDIEARLAKAGARSPGLLVGQAKGSFQFSDEGKLTNAEAVIDHLRRTFPEQFLVDPIPSIEASAGRQIRPALTKEALARMSPAEIQRLDWNEVKAALSNG